MTTNLCFLTMGDTNYFNSIALSAIRSKSIYPEAEFVVYDWGLSEKEVNVLRNELGAKVVDYKELFQKEPVKLPNRLSRIIQTFTGGGSLFFKYIQLKAIFAEFKGFGMAQKEWLLCQKPFVMLDWAKQSHHEYLVVLDGDAFLFNKIDELFEDEVDLVVTTRREEEIDFSRGHCQVLNSGVIVFNNNLKNRISLIEAWIDKMQESFEYLAEQSSLTRLILNDNLIPSIGERIEFFHNEKSFIAQIESCDNYNFNWIEEGVDKLKNKILHFKGGRHGYEQFKKLAFGIGLEEDFRSIETLINNSS